MQTRDPLFRAVLLDWPGTARDAGFEPEAYVPEVLSRRRETQVAGISLRMRAPDRPDLVFKRVFRPLDPGKWNDPLAAYRAARAALPLPFRPPAIRHVDDLKQCVVLGWQPGKSLADHLSLKLDQPDKRAELLRRVGEWLGMFHQIESAPLVALDAGPTRERMMRLIRRAQQDAGSIPDADLFLVMSEGLLPFEEAATGQPVPLGPQHGDLKARRLILEPKTTTALGFRGAQSGPVLVDLARLLADLVSLVREPDTFEAGVPVEDIEALETGYGRQLSHDPVLAYLLRAELFFAWAQMSSEEVQRSAVSEERLARVQEALFTLMRKVSPALQT